MREADGRAVCVHDDSVLFREAVSFTAARTGFSPRLIEKDYFCTVLLSFLAAESESSVVFKVTKPRLSIQRHQLTTRLKPVAAGAPGVRARASRASQHHEDQHRSR
jgi:hypothetical protein